MRRLAFAALIIAALAGVLLVGWRFQPDKTPPDPAAAQTAGGIMDRGAPAQHQ